VLGGEQEHRVENEHSGDYLFIYAYNNSGVENA